MSIHSVPANAPIAADSEHVGHVLRSLRLNSGLSTKETARRSLVTHRRLRDLEAGIGVRPNRLEVGLIMEVLADALRIAALASLRDASPGDTEHRPRVQRAIGPDVGGLRVAAMKLGDSSWAFAIEPTREYPDVTAEQLVDILDEHRRFAIEVTGANR